MNFRTAIPALLAFILSSTPAAAQFGINEIRGGVLTQSCCGQGSNKEQGGSINFEALFKSPKFLSVIGAPRPLVGAAVATDSDATSQIYGGLEWRIHITERLFITGTGGATVHNGEVDRFDPVADRNKASNTVFLGCRVLFRIGGDLGYEISGRLDVSAHWNHISNAELCSSNEGLDHLGARFGIKF
ncbi:MAG: acyloxyacyl hydrolase [Parvularculaceae bacterium]